MSCNCFNNLSINGSLSFNERLEQSKCHCNARFTVSEKRSKFSIEPKNLDCIDKIKVDGCLISSTKIKKCDYLFIYKDDNKNKTFVFVELKGVDLKTAIQQLENTIEIFEKERCLLGVDVRCGIAFKNFPKDNGTYRQLKRKMEIEFKNRLKSIRVEQGNTHLIYNCNTDKFRQCK